MELRTYLAAILKSWWVILIAALLGAGGGVAAYLLTPPSYASTVEFYVSTPVTPTNNPQSSGQFAESRVNSYIVLMSSEQLAREVVAATGVALTPLQVSRRIEATSQINTVIVKTTVTDTVPQRSLAIARGIATTFPKLVDKLDNQGRSTDIVVINVISGPVLQAAPVAPNRTLYIGAGLAAGLVLGLIIAILREALDTSVRTAEVAQTLVGAPVIGTINFDPDARRSPLIIGKEANSRRAEAYRQLRTNLQFIDAARTADVLVITSSVSTEGKSITAINLALTFVEFGERVLLIDADLRRPGIGNYLELSNDVGLTNVLAGQVDLSESIQPWGDEGLFVLASGTSPPNPSELLGSSRMAELIPIFRQGYDKIIVDTPPVLPVADAAVASAFADAVVFVVRHGKTSRTQVANATGALEKVGAPLVGSVLNMKRSSRAELHRYGRDHYYSNVSWSESQAASKKTRAPAARPSEPSSSSTPEDADSTPSSAAVKPEH